MRIANNQIIMLSALLLLLPTLLPFVLDPTKVVFNTNPSTPIQDELSLYAPLLERIPAFRFGDPQIQEYTTIPFNLMLVVQLLPFSLFITLFGLTIGYLLTLFLLTCLTIFSLSHILKNHFPIQKSIIIAFLLYLAVPLLRPSALFNLLSNFDFSVYFSFLSNGFYLMRMPSLSFTLPLLLLALIALQNMLVTGKRTLAVISLAVASIYFYNFVILATLLGLLLLFQLFNKKSYKNLVFAGIALLTPFVILYIFSHLVPADPLLGIAKFGATNTRAFTLEMLAGIILFAVASLLYFAKKQKPYSWPSIAYIACTALTIQLLLPLLTSFHIQPFHFLQYYALFMPLLAVTSYPKIAKNSFIAILVVFALILIVYNTPTQRFHELDPDFIDLAQNIPPHTTVLALAEENRYLLPIYARSYTYIGNAFHTYVNVTENLARYSQLHYLYHSNPDHILIHPNLEFAEFFHYTYVYHDSKRPDPSFEFEEKFQLEFTQPTLYQIPIQHKIMYEKILHQNWSLQDYRHFDYVLIDNYYNESIRWQDQFNIVYQNNRYTLLELNQSPSPLMITWDIVGVY